MTNSQELIALTNVLMSNTQTLMSHDDPASVDDCWMELQEGIRQLSAEGASKDEVLKWLRSATNAELAGYRDGYDSLVGREVTYRQKQYGDPYRRGFDQGLKVSPLLNDSPDSGSPCPDCGKPIDMDNYLSLVDHQECKIPIPADGRPGKPCFNCDGRGYLIQRNGIHVNCHKCDNTGVDSRRES